MGGPRGYSLRVLSRRQVAGDGCVEMEASRKMTAPGAELFSWVRHCWTGVMQALRDVVTHYLFYAFSTAVKSSVTLGSVVLSCLFTLRG
jgi:hypothetical protein